MPYRIICGSCIHKTTCTIPPPTRKEFVNDGGCRSFFNVKDKIDPDSITYRKREIQEAFSFCPTIKPCKWCGNPVVDGYCCGYCHSPNP